MMNDIFFMTPIFMERIWGGNKLNTDWNYIIPNNKMGECWAVSAHKNGSSIVCGGPFGGYSLSDLWSEHPEFFNNVNENGGLKEEEFPLLTKIIDAEDDLSIQVHPDDEYAREHENGARGKDECWYIVSAEPGSKLVVGHNAETKDELKQMIAEGRWTELIREVSIKKGDFISIPPGTIHSIKGGVQLLETQQNSDITYRFYDYDRLSNGKKRELHLDKCIDVVKVPALPNEYAVKETINCPKNEAVELISNQFYTVVKYDITDSVKFTQDKDYMIFSVVEGRGIIKIGEASYNLGRGMHFILPYNIGDVEILGELTIIASYK